MDHLRSLVLLVLIAGGGALCNKCPASQTTNLQLTVSSRRNISGHWLISVDAYGENLRSKQQSVDEQKDLVVDLEHSATYCHGIDTQHLQVNATVHGMAPPADYKPMAGLGYYKYYLTPLTWEQAKYKCEEDGAHLIILDSEKESIVIKEFYARKPNISGAWNSVDVFVGVHDRYKEGQFEDVFGTQVPTAGNSLWRPGQPNGKSAENCVVGKTTGEYADGGCDWKLPFICEFM
ncbi:hemolymph lipopolysaccharide-binding protein-like [Anabrus simplex]|uniref:hemolymph lipopolysaccharide-binding protein-like n=1 Tax=Anabrus simplex TaxID=316456 RepID=UPI0035A3833C